MSGEQDRLGSLTPAQVAALDAAAVSCGVSVMQLMEVAGWQVARCAWRLLRRKPGGVLVVAGRGNNGGDGLVAARHLVAWGCTVRAVMPGEQTRLRPVLTEQLAAARGAGVDCLAPTTPDQLASLVDAADLVVDGLFGTGLATPPRDAEAGAILAMLRGTVLAIDVPSGLSAETGKSLGGCVRAAATCTLTAMKSGLWTASGREHAGRLYVADIGMPATAWSACGLVSPSAVRGGTLIRVR